MDKQKEWRAYMGNEGIGVWGYVVTDILADTTYVPLIMKSYRKKACHFLNGFA